DNLQWVTENTFSWNKHFRQTADIDASATSGWDGGAGFKPIGGSPGFSGTYDGNGHTISGLFINRPTGVVGMFGYCAGTDTIIKNLGLIDIQFYGEDDVGGLVGTLEAGHISNCFTTGTISGSSSGGGIVGFSLF